MSGVTSIMSTQVNGCLINWSNTLTFNLTLSNSGTNRCNRKLPNTTLTGVTTFPTSMPHGADFIGAKVSFGKFWKWLVWSWNEWLHLNYHAYSGTTHKCYCGGTAYAAISAATPFNSNVVVILVEQWHAQVKHWVVVLLQQQQQVIWTNQQLCILCATMAVEVFFF